VAARAGINRLPRHWTRFCQRWPDWGWDRPGNQGATKGADPRGHLLDLSGFSVYVTPRIDHPGLPGACWGHQL